MRRGRLSIKGYYMRTASAAAIAQASYGNPDALIDIALVVTM